MTQYLITTFTDSTGVQHNHVTKARENQTFEVVEAESKEQAMKVYKAQRQKEALISLAKDFKKFKERLYK